MDLTVGKLEEILREYNPNTTIHVGCNCCNRSGQGLNLLQIKDRTNQTYGYIELNLNATHNGKSELNEDKEQFYTKEIEKLNDKIKQLEKDVKLHNELKEDIEGTLKLYEKVKKYRGN